MSTNTIQLSPNYHWEKKKNLEYYFHVHVAHMIKKKHWILYTHVHEIIWMLFTSQCKITNIDIKTMTVHSDSSTNKTDQANSNILP